MAFLMYTEYADYKKNRGRSIETIDAALQYSREIMINA